MKKLLLAFGMFLSSMAVFSQSFNTGAILQAKHFSAGINPVIENKNPGIYLHGGYGIQKKVDIDLKFGLFKALQYIGGDLEWELYKSRTTNLSLVTGAHWASYIGLDFGLSASFPINSSVTIFTGLDSDINFNKSDERFFWLPLGVELRMSRMISIILEADIPVVEFAPGIFGGGMVFYLD